MMWVSVWFSVWFVRSGFVDWFFDPLIIRRLISVCFLLLMYIRNCN